MNDKITLYIQTNDRQPIWDFIASAQIGAINNGYPVKHFNHIDEVPVKSTNIICGSVESASKFMEKLGVNPPSPMDMISFQDKIPFEYLQRKFWLDKMSNCNDYDRHVFVKPYHIHKDFYPFIHKSKDDYCMYLDECDYDKEALFQDVINIKSEWRVYICKGKILKACNYNGDPMAFPDSKVVNDLLSIVQKEVNYKSYSIDVAITDDNKTVLVELSDGWSLANYGLDEDDYFNFIKLRWLQIMLAA